MNNQNSVEQKRVGKKNWVVRKWFTLTVRTRVELTLGTFFENFPSFITTMENSEEFPKVEMPSKDLFF